MMTTIIIEDEKFAALRMQLLLQQCQPDITVLAIIDSIEDSIAWLRINAAPDFILLDIQLADGSAFEIFNRVKITAPVIFTTAYDQYAMDAFKVLSIDYLLKPVTAEALNNAIQKLKLLWQSTAKLINYSQLLQNIRLEDQKFKTRFLGKVGQKLFFIDAAEIAYFLASNKIVYLHTTDGNQYIIEYTLEELEKMIDPKQFFRVNRSVIVKAMAIDQVKPYVNSRLKIILKTGPQKEEAIVSRERVNNFKIWADN